MFQSQNYVQRQSNQISTLEAICQALDCQPGDILEYAPMPGDEHLGV